MIKMLIADLHTLLKDSGAESHLVQDVKYRNLRLCKPNKRKSPTPGSKLTGNK